MLRIGEHRCHCERSEAIPLRLLRSSLALLPRNDKGESGVGNDGMSGRQGAFTMIELMTAVVVLTVGLVFILQSLSSGMQTLNRAQRRFLAASIAAEKLEDLEERELREYGLRKQVIPPERITKQNKDFNVSIEIFPQSVDMGRFPQDFLSGETPVYFPQIEDRLQKVAVYVRWQERATPQELVLTTYLNAKQE